MQDSRQNILRILRLQSWGLPLLGVASLLLAWQFVLPWFKVPTYVVPTPHRVAQVFWKEGAFIWQNVLPTLLESVVGFILGNTLAVIFAVVFVYSRPLRAAYFPVVLFFNTIPVLALAPVIILIFGLGLLPKIIIAAVICFFPTLVNMIRGLQSITESEAALFRVLSASKLDVFLKLRFPRALPLLFASLRIASATAVIGAVVGEWIGSERGLGALIIQSTFNYQSDRLYAAIVASSSLAIALFMLVVLAEKLFLKVN